MLLSILPAFQTQKTKTKLTLSPSNLKGCGLYKQLRKRHFLTSLQTSPESRIQTASTVSDTLTLEGTQVKHTTLLASSNSSLDTNKITNSCCSLGKKLFISEAVFSPSGAALQCIGSTQSNTSDSDAHTRFRGKKQTTNPHKQPEPELTGVKEIRRHELLFQEACDASTPYPTAQLMSANRARCKASPKPPQKAVCAAESDTDSPTCTQPHEKYTGQGSYLVWQVSIHST